MFLIACQIRWSSPMMPDPMMELMKLKLAPPMELMCFLSGSTCLSPVLSLPSPVAWLQEGGRYYLIWLC